MEYFLLDIVTTFVLKIAMEYSYKVRDKFMITQTFEEFQTVLNERTKQFNQAKEEVKSQFVGIEEVIERVFDTLEQWFLLPKSITQPVIINLVGMSGTGKTSLVRAIAKALGLTGMGRFAEIDVPQTQNKPTITTIKDLIGAEALYKANEIPILLLFDEVDKAPTIDKKGNPIPPTLNRDLWALLSDGKVPSEEAKIFYALQAIVEHMDKHKIPLNVLHIKSYSRIGRLPNKIDYKLDIIEKTEDEEDEKDKYFPNTSSETEKAYQDLDNLIFNYSIYQDRYSSYGSSKTKIGNLYDNLIKLIGGTKFRIDQDNFRYYTTDNLVSLIKEIKESGIVKDYYDLSNSVFFTCSNLDNLYLTQAVGIRSIDADLLRNLSGKITTVQIKDCLSGLFRQEQVARLGNNLIAYPTFSSEDYRRIIRQKLDQLIELISKTCYGFELTIDSSLEKLIYDNGVYPTQGTRPVYSTINHIQSLFGRLIFQAMREGKKKSGILNYHPDKRLIVINCPSDYTSYVQYIGDYDPSKKVIDRNHLAGNSVSMAAKLVGYLSLFGIMPKKVVASYSNKEGNLFLPHKYVPSVPIVFKMIILELMEQAGQNVIFGDSASIEPSTSATSIASMYIRLQGQGLNRAVTNPFSPELGLVNLPSTDSEIEKLVGKGYKEAFSLAEKYSNLIEYLAIVIFENEGEISSHEIESAIVAIPNIDLFVQVVGENHQIIEPYEGILFQRERIKGLTRQWGKTSDN